MFEIQQSPVHGRGVFATCMIEAGDRFHTADLLVFPASEHAALQQTIASHYVFHIADAPGQPGVTVTGLAMSRISFINHATAPNCDFSVDEANLQVSFTARRDIAAGEELLIDYGDFAEKIGIADPA